MGDELNAYTSSLFKQKNRELKSTEGMRTRLRRKALCLTRDYYQGFFKAVVLAILLINMKTKKLRIFVVLNLLLAGLVAISALGGILLPSVYSQETVNWAMQGLAQDWVNLILVAPLLVISGMMALRGSLRWFLVWLGILVANLYSFIIYAFFIHFGILFPVYVAILGLTLYLIIFSISNLDINAVKKSFEENWSRKWAYILMIITGVFFYLAWINDIVSGLYGGRKNTQLIETGLFVNPIHVIDLAIFLPALIIAGLLLRKKNELGYFLAGPLLISLNIISVNIISISLFFKIRDVASGYGVMPIFIAMLLIQFFVALSFIRQISST